MVLTIMPNFLLSMPGGTELIILAVLIILLFGAKKIPELARGLGKGIKEFKDAKEGDKAGDDDGKVKENPKEIKH